MRRLLFVLLLAGAALFALEGGEYGTTDLIRQSVARRRLEAEIAALERDLDSLSRVRRSLSSDAGEQERIAREEFGMVRGDKEILYRFAEPTASGVPSKKTGRGP